MGWRTILALVFGIAGVLVLLSSDFEKIGTNPIGAGFVLAAAISWAIGTIIVKRVPWTIDLYALAGWQLLIGLVPIAVIAMASERFVLHEASPQAMWAGLYVVFLGLIAGYALWFKIIEILPVTIASISALMIPVIGVGSSALLLGEPVGWIEALALVLVLVLGAVGLVLFGPPPSEGSKAAE
ncbi:MAG: DMT family transporter [Alphaproteobacteria bacterium]